jgi:hypothetical protein
MNGARRIECILRLSAVDERIAAEDPVLPASAPFLQVFTAACAAPVDGPAGLTPLHSCRASLPAWHA